MWAFSDYIENHSGFDLDNYSTISNPDINGDGKSDVCWRHDLGYYCAMSNGNGTFTRPMQAFTYKIENHSGFDGDNYSTISNPDINGDGKSDVCWRHDSGYFCAMSNGNGTFTRPKLAFSDYIANHSGFDGDNYSTIRNPDINGDGKSDVCWRHDLGYYCAMSNGNGTFTFPKFAFNHYVNNHANFDGNNWPTISNPDINGDGRSDICWRHDSGYYCTNSWFNIVLGHIVSISNGIGSKTTITYKTAVDTAGAIGNNTGSCLKGGSKGHGGTCGIPNKAPRYLVQSVAVKESVSKHTYTTSYTYTDGRVYVGSVDKRAGLGFAEVKTTHPNTTHTINKYFQERRSRGILKETATYTSSWQLISKTVHQQVRQYKCNSTGCTLDRFAQVLPSGFSRQIRVGKTIKYQYKPGSSTPVITTTVTNTFNASYGYITQTKTVASGGGSSRTVYKLTEHLDHLTASPRVMKLPIKSITCVGSLNAAGDDCASASQTLKKSRFSYDGKAHGSTIGSGDKLSPTKVETWLGEKSGSDMWTSISRTFNSNGTLATETDDNAGNRKSYTYDGSYPNVVLSVTTTSGGSGFSSGLSSYTETFSDIDSIHIIPKTHVDKNGLKKEISLDVHGRITQTLYKNGNANIAKKTASYTLSKTERSVQECAYYGESLSKSVCSKEYKDSIGRPIKSVEKGAQNGTEKDIVTEILYDTNGREYMIYHPYFAGAAKGGYSRKYYDTFGRLSMLTRPDDLITRYAYDDVSLINGAATMRSVTDPERRIKRVYSDLAGRVMRVTEAAGTPNETHVDYTYYENDLLKSVSSPQGKTTITYNSLNQQASLTDPNAGITRYSYYETQGAPSFGQIKTEVRPDPNSPADSANTITLTNEYQASFGRLSRQYYGSAASPKLNRVFTYDDTAVNHSKGKLTRVVSKSGSYNLQKDFSYDIYGRTLSELRNISHASNTLCSDATALPCRSLSSWTYDKLGRLKSMTHPNNAAIQYEYIGGTGLFQKIKDTATDYVSYLGYNVHGQPSETIYGNGVETSYQYEEGLSYLRELKVEGFSQDSQRKSLLHYQYSFDSLGNITRIEDKVLNDMSVTYRYDSLNRIMSADRKGLYEIDFSYGFDRQGNLIKKEETVKKKLCYNEACTSLIRTNRPHHERYWKHDQYVRNKDAYSYSWSAAGNLISKTNISRGSINYTYDARNMLKKMTSPEGDMTRFFYDESGQRFLKIYKKKEADSLEIRSYYLSEDFELRESRSEGKPRGYQTTSFITGAGGQKIASITSQLERNPEELLGARASERFFALAGISGGLWEQLTFSARALGEYLKETASAFDHRFFYVLFFVLICWFFLRICSIHREEGEDRYLIYSGLILPVGFLLIFMYSCLGEVEEIDRLPEGIHYYNHNHLGSSTLITDSQGQEIVRTSYTPYGEIELEHTGKLNLETKTFIKDPKEDAQYAVLGLKFTGQEYDLETSLYYYNARYYDPGIGLFTTADTVVPDEYDPMSYKQVYVCQGESNHLYGSNGAFLVDYYCSRCWSSYRRHQWQSI